MKPDDILALTELGAWMENRGGAGSDREFERVLDRLAVGQRQCQGAEEAIAGADGRTRLDLERGSPKHALSGGDEGAGREVVIVQDGDLRGDPFLEPPSKGDQRQG